MRRFYARPLPAKGEPVTLGPEASHHLLRVVRIRTGETVELFDGDGHCAVARLVGESDERAVLLVEQAPRTATPAHARHLLVGIPKGQAMDLAVRQATEAGATHIHPLLLARSIARGDRAERWARKAASAAQQCGRGDVPVVLPLASLEEASQMLGDMARFVATPGGTPAAPVNGPAALLIGPEGGLAPDELRRAQKLGFVPVELGAWILRTETACAVGLGRLTP